MGLFAFFVKNDSVLEMNMETPLFFFQKDEKEAKKGVKKNWRWFKLHFELFFKVRGSAAWCCFSYPP
jgi:hypothetical protein